MVSRGPTAKARTIHRLTSHWASTHSTHSTPAAHLTHWGKWIRIFELSILLLLHTSKLILRLGELTWLSSHARHLLGAHTSHSSHATRTSHAPHATHTSELLSSHRDEWFILLWLLLLLLLLWLEATNSAHRIGLRHAASTSKHIGGWGWTTTHWAHIIKR